MTEGTSRKFAKWVVVGVLLTAGAVALNTLFPVIEGHIAIGLAAILLLLVIYW